MVNYEVSISQIYRKQLRKSDYKTLAIPLLIQVITRKTIKYLGQYKLILC